jgi:hypothetical protein
MGYQVLSFEDILSAGRKHPTFAMPDDEYPGVTGALARLGLTILAKDHLTPQAALEAGLNYYAAQGLTLVTVDQTSAGAMYVFSTEA